MDYKACVVGHPVGHSMSPVMHNAGFAAIGFNARYVAEDVEPKRFKNFIDRVRSKEFIGVSVTVPYKEEVMKYVNDITEEARQIGAINTLYFKGGVLVGDNTDWFGIKMALEESYDLRGKKVLVYGAGGAARAALFALADSQAEVFVTNRTASKSSMLAKEFRVTQVDPHELPKVDVLINATTVGLPSQNYLLVDEEWLKGCEVVFDMVYSQTVLEQTAKNLGCQIVLGKKMLLFQGVRQFELFTGFEAPIQAMAEALGFKCKT